MLNVKPVQPSIILTLEKIGLDKWGKLNDPDQQTYWASICDFFYRSFLPKYEHRLLSYELACKLIEYVQEYGTEQADEARQDILEKVRGYLDKLNEPAAPYAGTNSPKFDLDSLYKRIDKLEEELGLSAKEPVLT